MKQLTKQQMNILSSLASSPRKLHYFTHDKDTPIFKLTLTKLVHNGYIYEDGDNYHISTKGRQVFDAPGVAKTELVNDWRKGVYKTGDGDIITEKRPGSMDAFRLPSRGLQKGKTMEAANQQQYQAEVLDEFRKEIEEDEMLEEIRHMQMEEELDGVFLEEKP